MDLTGLGSVADLANSIINKIWPPGADPNKKIEAQLEIQKMIEARENTVVEAQKSIIVSEMQQSDNFTKRARPSVVYCGLGFIFLVHVAFPILSWFTKQQVPTTLVLPEAFWWAWSGCVGIWMIGRSVEKSGATGLASDLAKIVTGKK